MLVDYYGQLDLVDIEQARVFSSSRLIVDETHGFFRKPWSAVDTIYSCRKWFGVADGAYLATGDGERILRHVPRDESYARYGFVLGRFERPAGDFFAESSANNAFFDREPVKLMSFLTDNLLRAIDYRTLRDRRDMNWDFLDEALKGMNSLVLRKPEGAFMYPFMIENAQELRKQLIAAGIFVPLLWPNVFEERKIGSDAWKLSADILPLPLDQRYGEDEMEYIVETLVKSQG